MLRALGASVALPWLEAMHPSSPLAVTPKRPKLRAGYIYFPNGVSKGSWEPDKVSRKGELKQLSKWMKDLEPFKNDILIGHNIWTPRGNGHGAGTATWLTGVPTVVRELVQVEHPSIKSSPSMLARIRCFHHWICRCVVRVIFQIACLAIPFRG